MGIAVIGGLVVSSLFTLYVIPAMYTYLASRTVRSEVAEAIEEASADAGELSPEPARG